MVDVLGRFLNMGVEPYNFVSALNCILAQRLVRQVCDFCVQEVQYGERELLAERAGAGRSGADFRFQGRCGVHGVRRDGVSRAVGDP